MTPRRSVEVRVDTSSERRDGLLTKDYHISNIIMFNLGGHINNMCSVSAVRWNGRGDR
jgi:hypothetical protein